ncbi:DNA helicase Rep [Candidatus Profftia sp. (ex Adelges kitamiensis)]|uniref:DNA helicase Rep n=1 Tax=Candidatus Profftia sp. (ex Adelges kitamiensis) TaxID=2864218 RepID=UPI001CE23F6E|nr:DNA helicase Rep [Candidatus Profftia sp. (ex Adelges kitamiensis)]
MLLNSGQQKAVEFVTGPCLVLAGAGSGKTRVITNKIAYLIHQCNYKPSHIAAVTFTNKAAQEMKERTLQSIDHKEAFGLIISTLHSLGLEIIKNEYQSLGIKSNFSLFDNQDQLALLKDLSEKWLSKDKDLIKQLSSSISNWKNNFINPIKASTIALSERDKIFTHCYQLYETYLKSCNVLDFYDLILLPTMLLRNNKKVRERWHQRIQYLLVDEYQDTNTSQYELIKLLVKSRKLFTVVGDDDQSIYSWRGARPQNLILLKEDFPNLKVIKLEQNYRSSQRILKSASKLISNNPHFFKKHLFSKLSYGKELKIITANHEEHEAERVIGDLITHHLIYKTSYRDYAILYRGNYQSRVFEKILMQNRIPYHISGNISFFLRPEIKDLLAYLRIMTNPNDDSAFLRIVNTPRRDIGLVTLNKLGLWANYRKISLFYASFDIGLSQKLTRRGLEALKRFTSWIKELSILSKNKPVAALYDLMNGINYNNWLLEVSSSTKEAEIRIKNINQLFNWMTDMLKGNNIDTPPMTLTQVIAHFTLHDIIKNCENQDDTKQQVQLMTLHASKGLEFPYVYMVGMEEGLLPHQTSIHENNIDEERRLAYVGITRAQKELVFTLCRERRQYGTLIYPEPSRFLLELSQDDLRWEKTHKVVSLQERMQIGQRNVANIRIMLEQTVKKN